MIRPCLILTSNSRRLGPWLAWNIMRTLLNNTNFLDAKVEGLIDPGNQNFGSYKTITTYKFNNWLLNDFGTGLLVDAFGDPDLEWQKTIDKNIGFDVSMFNNRFHVNFDYYYKVTDPLMASIGIPLSVGVSQRLANVGKQVATTIKYVFIARRTNQLDNEFYFPSWSSYCTIAKLGSV
ncbi:MAG: hypothetical protein ACLUDU_12130 [Butyricimonas faecihominis]